MNIDDMKLGDLKAIANMFNGNQEGYDEIEACHLLLDNKNIPRDVEGVLFNLEGRLREFIIDAYVQQESKPDQETCDVCNGSWQGVNHWRGQYVCYHCHEEVKNSNREIDKHKYAVKTMKADLDSLATHNKRLKAENKQYRDRMKEMHEWIKVFNSYTEQPKFAKWFDEVTGEVKPDVCECCGADKLADSAGSWR